MAGLYLAPGSRARQRRIAGRQRLRRLGELAAGCLILGAMICRGLVHPGAGWTGISLLALRQGWLLGKET